MKKANKKIIIFALFLVFVALGVFAKIAGTENIIINMLLLVVGFVLLIKGAVQHLRAVPDLQLVM